jgi:tetratricopeptide (TPR) repeat protein
MRKTKIILALSVAVITFLVFLGTLRNGFVNWDDNLYVYENAVIRSFDGYFLGWAFFDLNSANWHPLTWMSHALDYEIWGLNPLGHHLTNNVLHAVNTFLLILLVVRLLETAGQGPRSDQGRQFTLRDSRSILIVALTTGLLFGLHPLHVESVAWVAERKDLLCALFYLLSIFSYIGYVNNVEDKSLPKSNLRARNYFLSVFLFIFALMSKPMAVTLPAVLIILDWYPFERPRQGEIGRIIFEKVPFFVLGLAASVLAVIAQHSGGALVSLHYIPLWERLVVGTSALVAYLGKMTVPVHLSSFYSYPVHISFVSFRYLAAVLAVTGITLSSIFLSVKRGRKLWLAVWSYYVITLLPVLGIVQVGEQSMADRYTYLPSIGPFLAAGLCLAWAYERFLHRKIFFKKLFAVALLCLLFSMSYLTIKRIETWKDSLTLWSDVIEKDPTVHFAFNNRGLAYREAGAYDRAMEDYNRAISLKPDFFRAYNNRGVILIERGMLDEALDDFNRASELNPDFYETYMNRGVVYDKKGLFDKAMDDFSMAVSLNPRSYKTFINRGVALDRRSFLDQALDDYNRAIAIYPQSANAYNNRAGVYYKKGLYREAIADFSRAIAINPGFRQAYYNRALVYSRMGLADEASADLRQFRVR